MRRILRLLIAVGLLAGLWVLLRELLKDADRRSRETGAGSTSSGRPSSSSELRPEQRTTSAPSGDENGAGELSKAELYRQAQRLDVAGRSKMSKEELARAVAEARRAR